MDQQHRISSRPARSDQHRRLRDGSAHPRISEGHRNGHGPAGSDIIDDVLGYLRFVQTSARAGHDAGLSPLATARELDLGPYADLGDPERIVGNLHRAYAELDGAPLGAPIDAAAALTRSSPR